MILLIIPIFLAIVGLIWFFKGPVAKSAGSLQEGGSSKTEAYVLVLLLGAVLAVTVYLIVEVI